ncbi:UBN2 domain-containing protein [Tanacetum coccineum]
MSDVAGVTVASRNKLKNESSDNETSTSGSDDEEYVWPENDTEDKTNDETCLMDQSSNEVTLNSSYYSDNESSLDNDTMQIEYVNLCEISLKIINKNKILKTKRDLLEKEILELNEKIKKLERSKEIDITFKLCQELKLENTRLKENQVKFDKSANSLREMLSNEKSSSCKIGLGFDSCKASTSGTKIMSFVGLSAENTTDGSTIKVHGSTIPRSVNLTVVEKVAGHVFSLPISSRSDFVITRKKLIHNRIEESKKPSLKPSLKSGLGYVKIESRYTWTRFLKTKNEAFEKFKILSRKIQNQLGSSIAAIRTDHGREFDNEVQFGAYCDAQGITHNFSALLEESLNVTFDESPPSTKLSPLVDDDVGEEEAIRNNIKVVNNNNEEDESIEVD